MAFATLAVAACGGTDARPDAGSSAAGTGGDAGSSGGTEASECRSISFPAPVDGPCVGTTRTVLDRPFCVHAPSGVAPEEALPLVVLLHAYGESGSAQAAYFGLDEKVESRRFILVKPDGTLDRLNQRFWNAFPVCCAPPAFADPPDDVAYIDAVIADVETEFSVDPAMIYATGHSNGAFMAQRYACDRAEVVAAFVSLAGGVEAEDCSPSEPVSMVEIHGTADAALPYDGGGRPATDPGGSWPSVADTMAFWAAAGQCEGDLVTQTNRDVAWNATDGSCGAAPDGDEAEVSSFDCPSVAVEHWKLPGGIHGPGLSDPAFADDVLDFLFAHPKR